MTGTMRRRAYRTRFVITFSAEGGTASATSMKTGGDGKLDSLPTATRSGYNFLGWFRSSGAQVTTETAFTADETVYAHWQAQLVTVTVTALNDVSTNGDPLSFVEYEGVDYRTKGSFSAEKGKTLRCLINAAVVGGSRSNSFVVNGATVKTRGSTVSSADGLTSFCYFYDHTLTKNCDVRTRSSGVVSITE